MNRFLLIVNLYMLVLSVLPCTDREFDVSQVNASVSTTHPDDNKGQEICPPFCSCSCCSILRVAPVEKEDRTAVSAAISFRYNDHLENSPEKVSLDIWQPPQLV